MSKKIYKYTLAFTDEAQLICFKNGIKTRLLCAKRQNNNIVVFVELEDEGIFAGCEVYYFDIYATGYSEISVPSTYLDTIMFDDKGLVWHVYYSKYMVDKFIEGGITR